MKQCFILIDMEQRKELGFYGETVAADYLEGLGYRIVERNHWKPWGELDIIAVARDRTLVFVEVKTMKFYSPSGLQPEDQMTSAKRRRFERAALGYANHYPRLVDERVGWRLDVIAITLFADGHYDLRHYENI